MLVNNSFLGERLALTSDEERQKAQLEADFAEFLHVEEKPEEVLRKITKNGVQGLMEHKIELLKQKIAAKVMASKGLTEEAIAAMPPEQRLAVLKQIMEEVQRLLKQAISEQMKKEQKAELGFMDAPVDTSVMKAMLAAQEYANAS